MRNFILATGILVSIASHSMAENNFKACNGKVYEIGDTLRIGKQNISGKYYHIVKVDEVGSVSYLNKDAFKEELIITAIPEYDKKLYENFAIFDKPDTPMIIEAKGRDGRYYIQLNEALANGYVMSDYVPSIVENALELSPEVLFIYTKKLYGEVLTDKDIEVYASLKDPVTAEKAKSDPFEWQELKTKFKEELVKSINQASFDNVFRIRCISELGQYNMEKKVFPITGYSCTNVETQQNRHLSSENYCLWGYCGFHFSNVSSYLNIPSAQDVAKGFYSMRKYINTPSYDKPVATSYVYVKIKEKPVSLPNKEIMVNFEWTTLQKEFGKRCLDMEIVRVDSYCYPRMDNETELVYNYLGTQK